MLKNSNMPLHYKNIHFNKFFNTEKLISAPQLFVYMILAYMIEVVIQIRNLSVRLPHLQGLLPSKHRAVRCNVKWIEIRLMMLLWLRCIMNNRVAINLTSSGTAWFCYDNPLPSECTSCLIVSLSVPTYLSYILKSPR